jgi:hypothetical protein
MSAYILVTDVGSFKAPAEASAAYRKAPKRKDGSLDMRFSSSRMFMAWEEAELKRILAEWATGADPTPPQCHTETSHVARETDE